MAWRLIAVELEMPEVLAGASACGLRHAELLSLGHLLEDASFLLLFLFDTYRPFFFFKKKRPGSKNTSLKSFFMLAEEKLGF